jgi:hypothetical protein
MANAIYPKYKQSLLAGDANISLTTGSVRVALVDTNVYSYNAAHDFLNDVTGITATSAALGTKTVTDGTFAAGSATFTSVTGNQSEALVIYIDTGVAATSRLVAFLDTSITGLPVTPNGGDITVSWNASGIFRI